MDVAANLAQLERALAQAPRGALAVAPEGLLSGYLPQPGFVEGIDRQAASRAIDAAAALARTHGVTLAAGGCLRDADGRWRNAALVFEPGGRRLRYDKCNLATSERADFTPGDALPVFDVEVGDTKVRLGVQMCREIRYPQQWRVLAAKGAQVIAYLNNAVGNPTGHSVWRAHVVSRAAELQRFVVGANNVAPEQTCPSLIVDPTGAVLAEAPIGAACVVGADLELDKVSNWNLDQARTDLS